MNNKSEKKLHVSKDKDYCKKAIVTSPYELNILDQDFKQQKIN